MNHILQGFARQWLKDHLAQLTPEQHLVFKRMYSHSDLKKSIEAVVDSMSVEKLDWAMTQVENTLAKISEATIA